MTHLTRTFLMAIAMLIACSFACADARAATLPTEHEYQRVLRDYLSTLTEQDYALQVKPIELDKAWLAENDERLFRHWLLHMKIPAAVVTGIVREPKHFLLSSIEREDGVYMTVGRAQWVSAEASAWWTTYDYPGNPYYQSRALRLRAFTAAAVDMMMLDAHHESGKAKRADWLGGTTTWLGYTFTVVRDELPPEVQKAYQAGLEKMAMRIMAWGPTRVNDNIDIQSITALWFASQALPADAPIQEAMRKHVKEKLIPVYHASGVVRDAGGLETSYNGIAYYFLTWATLASDWPELDALHAKVSDVKSHLTLPDPDGAWWSPSHFNSRTSAGAANDQWADPYRDWAAAMASRESTYLVYTGRMRNGQERLGDQTAMLNRIQNMVGRINRMLKPNGDAPGKWKETHWTHGINFAYEYYVPGSYEHFRKLDAQRDPLTQAPFQRQPGWVRVFPKPEEKSKEAYTFVVTRQPSYGSILYHGPLGWHSYMNYGGSALSAYWTPQTGSVILGRKGSFAQGKWSEWRVAPTHAMSGVTEKGTIFSTARNRNVVIENASVNGNRVSLTARGELGVEIDKGKAISDRNMDGKISYSRSYEMDESAVRITTRMQYQGSQMIAACYEMLPVFLRDERRQARAEPTAIRFRVSGQWHDASVEPMAQVDAIELVRFNGKVEIRLDRPRSVMLSPEVWKDDYETRAHVRNIMIDMTPLREGDIASEVSYTIVNTSEDQPAGQ